MLQPSKLTTLPRRTISPHTKYPIQQHTWNNRSLHRLEPRKQPSISGALAVEGLTMGKHTTIATREPGGQARTSKGLHHAAIAACTAAAHIVHDPIERSIERSIAFAMVRHKRLSETSPFRQPPDDVMRSLH